MTQEEEVLTEIQKCRNSPYYFATKYLIVQNYKKESAPFTTRLTEEEFNKMVNSALNKNKKT